MFFLSLFAGIAVKVLGTLGGSGALAAFGSWLNNRERQKSIRFATFGKLVTAAMKAEVDMRQVVSSERQALWNSAGYRWLTYLIIVPPSLHMAAVFLDTTFSFIDWKVPSAPPPFDEWGGAIVLSFVGAKAFVGAAVGAARQFKKV